MGKKTRYEEMCEQLARKKPTVNATPSSVDKYLSVFYNYILEQLDKNGEVVIGKFGKFYLEHIDEREMIASDGKEKKYIYVQEKDNIKFTPFKTFKDDVNRKYGVVSTHGNADNIPLKATIAELFQQSNEKRKRKD